MAYSQSMYFTTKILNIETLYKFDICAKDFHGIKKIETIEWKFTWVNRVNNSRSKNKSKPFQPSRCRVVLYPWNVRMKWTFFSIACSDRWVVAISCLGCCSVLVLLEKEKRIKCRWFISLMSFLTKRKLNWSVKDILSSIFSSLTR